jgi:hypothetical protein
MTRIAHESSAEALQYGPTTTCWSPRAPSKRWTWSRRRCSTRAIP